MRTLVAVVLVCGCKGDPPASTPPAPGSGSGSAARPTPPADAATAPLPVKPTALATDIAAVFSKEVQVLRKGAAPGSKPRVFPMPTEGPAIWSEAGELFVGLKGGDVARLAGDQLVPIKLSKQLKKLAHGDKSSIKRDVGFNWTHDDGLSAGADGSVWLAKCDYWYKGDADGCDSHTHLQLAPVVKKAEQASKNREGGGLPKVAAPPGFTITKIDGGFTCQQGATKLDVHRDGGKPDLTAWLTQQPARVILNFHFDDESGEIGDREEYWLMTDCATPSQITIKSSVNDVYAVRPVDDAERPLGEWIVVQAGFEVARFAGDADVVLGHGDPEEAIPH